METYSVTREDLLIGQGEYRDETVAMTITGVAGSITDTTTYPVAAQATKTEKFTIDGGTEQTVTFTTDISRGRARTTNSWPVSDQTGLTVTYKTDGGATKTVTFGTCTTQAHALAQLNAQLAGAYAVSVGTAIHVLSLTKGATSEIEIVGGTASGITWATEDTCNTAEDIASQLNDQLEGCTVGVLAGQVKITSDLASAASSVVNGTGTADLTWASDVDGTGVTGTVKKGTLLARNSSTLKMTVYSSGGSNAENVPVAVMPRETIWSASGELACRVLFKGDVLQSALVVHDSATAPTLAELQALMANSSIIPVNDTTVGA